jgi:hypothetical protein
MKHSHFQIVKFLLLDVARLTHFFYIITLYLYVNLLPIERIYLLFLTQYTKPSSNVGIMFLENSALGEIALEKLMHERGRMKSRIGTYKSTVYTHTQMNGPT